MKKILAWPTPLLQKWLLSLLLCLPFLAAAIISAFSGDRTFLILSALLLLFCGVRCAELYVMLANERYGGTFAQKDIAFEFASWISAEFKLYIIKDYQRLKNDENSRLALGWNLNRTLAKINYRVHTDAIKDMLIPPDVTPQRQSYTYANEADVLNVALFGITAKEWRQAHPDSKGNIRDEASLQQLIVLANMESINAELIRQGVPQSERLLRLNASAKQMMQSLTNDHRIEVFKEYGTLPHESE